MRGAIVLLVVAALAASAGCGGSGESAPAELTGEVAAPDELTGEIVAIDGEGSEIRSFTLASEGEEYEILIAPDVDYGFDLAHLHEHEAAGDPVHCRLEERDGDLYALSIEDA